MRAVGQSMGPLHKRHFKGSLDSSFWGRVLEIARRLYSDEVYLFPHLVYRSLRLANWCHHFADPSIRFALTI